MISNVVFCKPVSLICNSVNATISALPFVFRLANKVHVLVLHFVEVCLYVADAIEYPAA